MSLTSFRGAPCIFTAAPARQIAARAVAPPATSTSTPTAATPPSVKVAEPGRVFYFAFGANMSQQVTSRRNLKPRSAVAGTVRNHKLFFQHIGGYATIEYRPDELRPDVQGVVMDLSEAEMKRLSAMELGYDVRDVIVTAADGTGYRSKAFITEWSVRLFEESAPTHDYIGKLRAGAEQFNLPSKYQDWLNGIESREYAQTTQKQISSPSTFIAVGISAAIFSGAMALLVRPR